MAFIGFSEDGTPLYDTKEAAIERAKQLVQHGGDPDAKILERRNWAPGWLARLSRGTALDFLFYKEIR